MTQSMKAIADNYTWIDWRDWNKMDFAETRDVLIPDAKLKGCWWGVSEESSSSTTETVLVSRGATN